MTKVRKISTGLTGDGEMDRRASGDMDVSYAATGRDGGTIAQIKDSVVRLYAVGPVHGALDDLQAVDRLINRDAASCRPGETAVLHAGSYIDKGNQIPELMNKLERRKTVGSAPVTYLMGAHEWLMLRALAGNERAALLWLLSGAEASLERWRVPVTNWIASLPNCIPQNHITFLRGLFLVANVGETRFVSSTFVSAAARPFGLFGERFTAQHLLGEGPFTPVGSHCDVMRGIAPLPWRVRSTWSVGRIGCTVLERSA